MQASVTGASQTQTAFSYNELTPAPPAGSTIIYMGAMGKAIQMLKRVSIMSLASAWAATPLFAYTAMTGIGSGSGGASTNAAIVVMTGGIVLSSLSTSVIQWACKPYVTAIASTSRATQSNTINPNEQQLAITRIGLFGTPYTVTIAASDLRPAKGRLFATWQTNAKTEELLEQKGRKNAKRDFFFVHADSVENDSEAGRLIDEVVKREADLVLAGVESIAEAAANNLAGSQLKEDWDQVVSRLRSQQSTKK
ncbi:hypothetical protein HK100_006189 [Physocladia obscura]|uniref:Uncharacterized protein n=1 Tax=Physocladia obscura TaxID=109957 RepID=A0AAD5XKF0_9FUNG|nr:hypothetical protein HK100_006189 [Physocladia obscura]